jgi:hypothetical protein
MPIHGSLSTCLSGKTFSALERFVYQTIHKQFYNRRAEWFEHFEDHYFVIWWGTSRPAAERRRSGRPA